MFLLEIGDWMGFEVKMGCFVGELVENY